MLVTHENEERPYFQNQYCLNEFSQLAPSGTIKPAMDITDYFHRLSICNRRV